MVGPVGQSDETVLRYAAAYEEHMNPFRAFNVQERQRKFAALNPADKFSLSLVSRAPFSPFIFYFRGCAPLTSRVFSQGRAVLTSQYARIFLFVYTMLLHGLVFVVLYKLSHAEGCKRDMAEACLMQCVGDGSIRRCDADLDLFYAADTRTICTRCITRTLAPCTGAILGPRVLVN